MTISTKAIFVRRIFVKLMFVLLGLSKLFTTFYFTAIQVYVSKAVWAEGSVLGLIMLKFENDWYIQSQTVFLAIASAYLNSLVLLSAKDVN